MNAVVADVVYFEDGVPWDLLLDAKAPVFDVGRAQIGVYSCQRLATEGEVRLWDGEGEGCGELVCRRDAIGAGSRSQSE